MVYFVRHQSSGLIKIGYSSNVSVRMRQLVAMHGPLDLLAVLFGSLKTEGAHHACFASCRAVGEWFRPAHELTDYIAGLTSCEPVGPVADAPRTSSVYAVPPIDPLSPYVTRHGLTLTTTSTEPRWPRAYR